MERLRSAQSKAGSSLYSSLSRPSLNGQASLTTSRGLPSSLSDSRSLTHSNTSTSAQSAALQQRPSLPSQSPHHSSSGSHLERVSRGTAQEGPPQPGTISKDAHTEERAETAPHQPDEAALSPAGPQLEHASEVGLRPSLQFSESQYTHSDSDLQSSSGASSHGRSDSLPPLQWDRAMDDHSEMERFSLSSSVGSHSGHYNPQNDVIMRIEFLGEKSMKTLVVSVARLLTSSLPAQQPGLPPGTPKAHPPAGNTANMFQSALSFWLLARALWMRSCCIWKALLSHGLW